MARRLIHILLAATLLATPLSAQSGSDPQQGTAQSASPAMLVADDVTVTRDRVLTARGNVEAYQGTTRLRASAITYDEKTGALVITGPITIEDGEDVVIVADQAELSRDLQNGLLTGARMVLNQQLQLAAVEMNRVGGRYTQLYKTAVTSCQVCDDGRPPLWQIRARRVVHDKQARQLYFDDAQFRIGNVPVFYMPRLRLPDPTLKRATGFLIPSLSSDSQLGTGVKVPYFIKLGDHRDLTLTPYLTSHTTTMEFRYRQAFRNGRITFEGALSDDDLQPGDTRGYLFGSGRFDLKRDFVLTFNIETTTDTAYLTDYNYSGKDRLASAIEVARVKRDAYVSLRYTNFRSLRVSEDNDTLPTNVLDARFEKRFFPRAVGGELRFSGSAHAHYRESDVDTDVNLDGIVDGRDVQRVNLGVEWLRSWTLTGGVRAEASLGVEVDAFSVSQDATFPDNDASVTPQGQLTLRYPLVRHSGDGSTQMLEPILQVGFVGGSDLDVPNEESTRVEFDEGNLLSLSRFPRSDRRERGQAAAYGVNWSRFDPAGWEARLTFGQVVRRQSALDYSETSGLSGTTSDFLLAGQWKTRNGLALTGRTVFNESFDVAKAELRGDWIGKRTTIGGSYVWLGEDAAEDRAFAVSELTLASTYDLNRNWTASANWRYDLVDDRAAYAGAGLTYNNECVSAKFSVTRRYSSSISVEPSTNLGFTVSLRGFSVSQGTEKYVRSCGKRAK
ncbi:MULTISPECIES: LPS-assembly protein LptD [Roseobacteraceae]|uniref:LPS-assembly protein LptD n=1 Tax=Pseudosulfitobacter pseudonitzschiae TaxID=1402135 RepID=A0A221JZI8_9RHOB|nr:MULTISPECIES: LPS assembly protein LptD [Roseobacteraceae]ASM72141.1 LPS-assembly protein LptD [Pseudosulfitobacter pseudonitzschiae]